MTANEETFFFRHGRCAGIQITEADLAALAEDDFATVWPIIGQMVRARAKAKTETERVGCDG